MTCPAHHLPPRLDPALVLRALSLRALEYVGTKPLDPTLGAVLDCDRQMRELALLGLTVLGDPVPKTDKAAARMARRAIDNLGSLRFLRLEKVLRGRLQRQVKVVGRTSVQKMVMDMAAEVASEGRARRRPRRTV